MADIIQPSKSGSGWGHGARAGRRLQGVHGLLPERCHAVDAVRHGCLEISDTLRHAGARSGFQVVDGYDAVGNQRREFVQDAEGGEQEFRAGRFVFGQRVYMDSGGVGARTAELRRRKQNSLVRTIVRIMLRWREGCWECTARRSATTACRQFW
jgi:hypothetical protein